MRVAKCPWAVATGVVLQFLVMPVVGFTLAKSCGFAGELAAGCVLVGSVAGALAADVLKSAVAARPADMFSIWMNFSGSVLANYWSCRPVGTAKEGV